MDVSNLSGWGAVSSRVNSVFDDMAIAEQVIAQAQKRHPDHAGEIWNSFTLLQRTPAIPSDVLYKAHIGEILGRVMAGEDTRPATRSEMLGMAIQVSAQMKMNRTGIRTVIELSEGLQVDSDTLREATAALREDIGREEYQGHTAEIIAELRKKLAVADRVA